MKTLPAELADPLHILSPFPWRMLALLAAVAVLALLWAWRRRRRRRRPASVAPAPPPRPARGPGLGEAIKDIHQRYVDADRRRGCHELSAALRSHYDARGSRRISTLTAREMETVLGDGALARVFGVLANYQFGRREPSRSDFSSVCELAVALVRQGVKT